LQHSDNIHNTDRGSRYRTLSGLPRKQPLIAAVPINDLDRLDRRVSRGLELPCEVAHKQRQFGCFKAATARHLGGENPNGFAVENSSWRQRWSIPGFYKREAIHRNLFYHNIL
jgi:hypothetical protein